MSLAVLEKDPDETIDYVIDWTRRLNAAGGTTVTVSSASHTVDAGITMVSESTTDSTTSVRLSGGSDGNQYKVEVLMTTSGGEIVQEEFYISVVER